MEIANPSDEITEAEEEMSRREEFLRLHKTLTGLPLKYQEVISLRFFEKKSIKDISQILGKKEGTVKSLLHRGLEQLRAHME
jgi:RNA polymerase sigma-70 factor (ECF subfamily)